jgi:hypothetical protein
MVIRIMLCFVSLSSGFVTVVITHLQTAMCTFSKELLNGLLYRTFNDTVCHVYFLPSYKTSNTKDLFITIINTYAVKLTLILSIKSKLL